MLPNFLVVGAEKAGTTSLAQLLSDHPEVFMCEPKEPRYFTQNWGKGESWYRALFQESASYKAIGEASPAYTWAPESVSAVQKIYDLLGPVKFVYLVRHPIERMISHYQHAKFCHWIPADCSFEKALQKVPGIKDCSRYYYQIEQFLTLNEASQWHVLALEELIQEPQLTANHLFEFLDLSPQTISTLPAQNKSENKHRPPAWVHGLRNFTSLVPSSVIQPIKQRLSRVGEKMDAPVLSEDFQNTLMTEFQPDIDRLSSFCQKDFKQLWNLH